MADRPYEKTFIDQGDLCFLAEVPSLAHIGRRFDELTEESERYTAPADMQSRWAQLTRQLQELMNQTASGKLTTWPEVREELRQEFSGTFDQAHQRIPANVHEYFETGQMPLLEYLEWVLWGAEMIWMANGGLGLDANAFQARVDRLSNRLRTAGYEGEMDRRLRAADPERYEQLTKSAQFFLDTMLPLAAQTRQDLVEQATEQPQEPSDDQVQLAYSTSESQWQADTFQGSYLAYPLSPASGPEELNFNCGRRNTVAHEQIALFEEFVRQQEQLRPGIEHALREMHRWMDDSDPFAWPGDVVLFPEHPDESDVPLQCFRIRYISLEPGPPGRIILKLDTQFGHFDEHGCSILIQDGAVQRYGTWDDVFGDEGIFEEE